MRASPFLRGTWPASAGLGLVATTLCWVAATGPALAADGPSAPAACGSGPTLTDPAGDGHHPNTDVQSAWLTESGGRLQAVVKVTTASWAPAHDDSDAAAVAMLFTAGGVTKYVRGVAPRTGAIAFDAGTWTSSGGFVTTASTSGSATTGTGGTLTIDVPDSLVAGANVLSSPFVLTYDGVSNGTPHWVDAAPGGTTPETVTAGADYVLGSCRPSAAPIPGDPVIGAAPATLTAVQLTAPARVVGAKKATLTGTVTPARAGVTVNIAATTRPRTTTLTATTAADGSVSVPTTINERTTWRATAEGLGSQTLTTRVIARVSATVRRTASGGAVVTGTVSPDLPGRVLWLRTDQVSASATARSTKGRFTLRLKHPKAGRYQALFIPSKARAERALSTRKTIR